MIEITILAMVLLLPIIVIGIAILVKIHDVHKDINSRVDQLLAIANVERFAAGKEAGRLEEMRSPSPSL